jgi:capsular polysaccharide biosynthesis protein
MPSIFITIRYPPNHESSFNFEKAQFARLQTKYLFIIGLLFRAVLTKQSEEKKSLNIMEKIKFVGLLRNDKYMEHIQQNTNTIPLQLLFTWRKVILITVLSTILLATIITLPFIMPPIYKAEAIIYPPATYSAKFIAEYDLRFGADKETDEHIQILKSSILRDSIIRKYKLMEHYHIDKDESYAKFKLNKLYDENILVERTRYNSISITVLDEHPELSAKICNDIIKMGDRVKTQILKQNLWESVRNIQQKMLVSNQELQKLGESVNLLNPAINLNYSNLSKQKFADRIKAELDLRDIISQNRNSSNPKLLELLFDYEDKLTRFNAIKDSYETAYQTLNTRIADAYVITPAQVPDKKYAPKRTLIVLFSGIVAFLLSCGVIIAMDRIKQIRESLQLK